MQEISNEVLRMGAGGYLLWYLCCVIFVGVMENRREGFKTHHIVSVPFIGVCISVMVPVIILSVLTIILFILKLFMFVITGDL